MLLLKIGLVFILNCGDTEARQPTYIHLIYSTINPQSNTQPHKTKIFESFAINTPLKIVLKHSKVISDCVRLVKK